jgi:hypothetical protein
VSGCAYAPVIDEVPRDLRNAAGTADVALNERIS